MDMSILLTFLTPTMAAVSAVSAAGIIYPFKPFGTRTRALNIFVLGVLGMVVIPIMMPPQEDTRTNTAINQGDSQPALGEWDVETALANVQGGAESATAMTSDGKDETSPGFEDAQKKKQELTENEVRKWVELSLWKSAGDQFKFLSSAGLATDAFKDEIEKRALELIKPLPASEREKNLKGYQFLSIIRPENSTYATKIEFYERSIEAERQRIVSLLKRDVDRVEGITWYKHPNKPRYLNSRSTAFLYIGKRGETGRPFLRLRVVYAGNDWLFVNSVEAWHDGIKEPLVSGNFDRDNNTSVWEWVDISPDPLQVAVLRSLGSADEAILRFRGMQYKKDVRLSKGDKKAIREVLEAYDIMRGKG